jgi:hypothetical protein
MTNGSRRGLGFCVTPRPLFTSRKDPVRIVQEAVWAPGPVWTGAENLAPYRDSIPGPSSPKYIQNTLEDISNIKFHKKNGYTNDNNVYELMLLVQCFEIERIQAVFKLFCHFKVVLCKMLYDLQFYCLKFLFIYLFIFAD